MKQIDDGQQRQPAPPKVVPPKDSNPVVPDNKDKYPGDPTEWADSDNDLDNFDELARLY